MVSLYVFGVTHSSVGLPANMCMYAGLPVCMLQVTQQCLNDTLSILRSTEYTAGGSTGPVGKIDSVYCVLTVAGPFFAMGLVDLSGRLWETNMQVPESQPSYRFGPSG